MPVVHRLYKGPRKGEIGKVKRELEPYKGIRPRLAFPFALSPNRVQALDLVKKRKITRQQAEQLIESPDFVVQRVGKSLLERAERKPVVKEPLPKINALRKRMTDPDPYVRGDVVKAAAKLGEGALPLLSKMANDSDPFVRIKVAGALGEIGSPKGMPIIEKMAAEEGWGVRGAAAEAAGRIGGNEGGKLLNSLVGDDQWYVRMKVAKGAKELGGKTGTKLLEKLAEDSNEPVRIPAERGLLPIKGRKWLLGTQKPFLAGDARGAMEKSKELERVAKQLKKEFGDEFVGLTVFGSTSKGFAMRSSDIDYAIISTDRRIWSEIEERFRELAGGAGLHPCVGHPVTVDRKSPEHLFHGLFFGNHRRLLQMQRKFIENTTEQEWEKIRQKRYTREMQRRKAGERLGIDYEPLADAATLLSVPPPLVEMRRIIRRRTRR